VNVLDSRGSLLRKLDRWNRFFQRADSGVEFRLPLDHLIQRLGKRSQAVIFGRVHAIGPFYKLH
jgi:hypothetical protein